MITIVKSQPPPTALSSDRIKALILAHAASIAAGDKVQFSRKEWTGAIIKKKVYTDQQEKCCFCESWVESRGNDVDHYRPKGGVVGCAAHNGYWWLAYNWENLFFSCGNCNRYEKKHQFPLLDDATRAYGPADDIAAEVVGIICPTTDRIDSYFTFFVDPNELVWIKCVEDGNVAAAKTIEMCGLNRWNLCRHRHKAYNIINPMVEECFAVMAGGGEDAHRARARVRELVRGENLYAAMIRDCVRKKEVETGIAVDD